MTDMSKYAGDVFITVDDLPPDRRRRGVITAVSISEKYDKPQLHFTDGTVLSLNKKNTRNMIKAYGRDGKGWIGAEIEMFRGESEYNNETQKIVMVVPISAPRNGPDGESPAKAAKKTTPEAANKTDFDDEVPFN